MNKNKIPGCAVLLTVLCALSACGVLVQQPAENTVTTQSGNAAVKIGTQSVVPRLTSGALIKTAGTQIDTANEIRTIYSTNECGELSTGGFVWFTDAVNLDDWLTPLANKGAAEIKSQINFVQNTVLLIDFGAKPTPGFGVELLSDQLERSEGEGIVKVKQLLPSPRKRLPQVVTHLCTLLAVPKNGFDTLVVVNEHGERLMVFSNSPR